MYVCVPLLRWRLLRLLNPSGHGLEDERDALPLISLLITIFGFGPAAKPKAGLGRAARRTPAKRRPQRSNYGAIVGRGASSENAAARRSPIAGGTIRFSERDTVLPRLV